MNPASRALLSQGFHVARRSLTTTLHRPRAFSSTPHTPWGASLSFRFAYSNDPAPTPPTNPDFPINIIDRQQSLHTLATLLQAGKLEQARQTLKDICESGPIEGDLDFFRQIKDTIAPPDSDDDPPVVLVVQLASASLSRGYVSFARDEVLPLLGQFGTGLLAAELERAVAEAESSRRTQLKSREVFEDASDDYTSILSESKPIQASQHELMLEQLPSVLPEPLLNDSSLFEEEAAETIREELSMKSSAHVGNTSLGTLHQLLSEGSFQTGYQFLQQMLELGIEIPHDSRYGQIALALLKTPDLPAERSDEFIAWLDLIPSFDALDSRRMAIDVVAEVMNIFIRSTHPDLTMITRLTLSFTSKGYSEVLYDAVEIIVSSLPATACTKFIRGFEEHERRFCELSGFSDTLRSSRRAGFQNRVVQTLAMCNQFITANEVFNEMVPSTITDETLRCHKRAKDGYQRISAKQPSEKQEFPIFREKFGDEPQEIDFGDDLVTAIRHLKHRFARNTHAPNPLTFSGIMAQYLSTGRTFGLELLVKKAYRCKRSIVASMILAEMLLYRRMKLPFLVIEAFVENFELHDVPAKSVLDIYERSKKKRDEQQENPIKRIIGNPDLRGVVSRKMWPTSGHYTLVWEALITQTSPRDIRKLYDEFLQILSNRLVRPVNDEVNDNSGDVDVDDETKTLMTPTPTPTPTPTTQRLGAYIRTSQFSASAFVPFFRPLMAARGIDAGQEIFNDMLKLGITPDLPVYTELVGQMARHGAVDRVYDIIYRLEAETFRASRKNRNRDRKDRNRKEKEKEKEKEHVYVHVHDEKMHVYAHVPVVPKPDFMFYVSALRGFIIGRDAKAARNLVQHIERRFPDAQGEMAYDHALEDLNGLETLGDDWVYTDREVIYPKPHPNP